MTKDLTAPFIKLKSRKNQDGFVAMLIAQQRAMRKHSYQAPEYIENV